MAQPRHLLHVFSTFGIGGPEVRTCDLINHFGARYRHTIIAMDGNYECQTKLLPGAPVEFIEVQNHRQNLLKNLRQFSRLLRQLKPDVLLTYNWGAIEWGLANSLLRVCPHFHGEDGFGPEEAATQKKRRIYARKIFLAGVRKIIVPSRGLEKIAQQSWKFPASRVAYIPNGVDLNKYSRSPSQQRDLANSPELMPHAKSLLIGTVATLRKEKNIPRLLRAFAKISADLEVKLIVVGNGPEYQNLWQFIQTNKLTEKVILAGHKNDPSELVRAFDIFAISSDTEQMPLSILEAMAAGCPIVGTDVGDIKDMVAPENISLLCPPHDEDTFTNNLSRLLADAELRARLGQKNYHRCLEMFDKSKMFENYEKLYDLSV